MVKIQELADGERFPLCVSYAKAPDDAIVRVVALCPRRQLRFLSKTWKDVCLTIRPVYGYCHTTQ